MGSTKIREFHQQTIVIEWDFMGFYGIVWDFMGFMGLYGISWDIMGYEWDFSR